MINNDYIAKLEDKFIHMLIILTKIRKLFINYFIQLIEMQSNIGIEKILKGLRSADD